MSTIASNTQFAKELLALSYEVEFRIHRLNDLSDLEVNNDNIRDITANIINQDYGYIIDWLNDLKILIPEAYDVNTDEYNLSMKKVNQLLTYINK